MYQIDLFKKAHSVQPSAIGSFEPPSDKLLSVRRSRLMRAERRRPSAESWFSRKEVIQPQVLLQLPCYDFTPIMDHTVGACLLAVGSTTSSTTHFRDVTGGVYKTRERIHRSMLICDY